MFSADLTRGRHDNLFDGGMEGFAVVGSVVKAVKLEPAVIAETVEARVVGNLLTKANFFAPDVVEHLPILKLTG